MVIPTLFIFALVVLLGTRATFDGLRQAAEERLRVEVSLNAARVEDKLEGPSERPRMAEAQVAGMFGDRKASLEMARLVLQNSPEFTGCYFGYEPNADQQDAASVGKLPAEAMDKKGRFIPYWFVVPDRGRTIKLEPLVNMETSLYYQAQDGLQQHAQGRAFGHRALRLPGQADRGASLSDRHRRQIHGCCGSDFALADVEAELRRTAEREQMDLFLISSRGRFIAATTDPHGDEVVDTKGC